MTAQNLVSAVIPPGVKADITTKLADIKAQLTFTTALQGGDIRLLAKAGNGFKPFVQKAYAAAQEHEDIMPRRFDFEEYTKDYNLALDLSSILQTVNELAESIGNTMIAVNSDLMVASLKVYGAVQDNRDEVPGLNATADDLAVFFSRSGVGSAVTKPAGDTL